MSSTIGAALAAFPEQGQYLSKKVRVIFPRDKSSQMVGGEIVRDDIEKPLIQIIKLEDGRYVLSTECHYFVSD